MLLDYTSLVKQFKAEVSGVIHVGGHVGEELNVYEKNNVNNLIIFEPQKDCFDVLSEQAKHLNFENLILVNKALGSYSDSLEMYCNPGAPIEGGGLCSSILKPKEHLVVSPDVEFTEKKVVDMVTLDSVIEENHNYNFLNMDTQGYELEVLKGAKRVLKNIDYVYTEVNSVEMYEGCALIQDLDNFLSQYDFVRIKTGWHGSGTWGDAFYIRQELV